MSRPVGRKGEKYTRCFAERKAAPCVLQLILWRIQPHFCLYPCSPIVQPERAIRGERYVVIQFCYDSDLGKKEMKTGEKKRREEYLPDRLDCRRPSSLRQSAFGSLSGPAQS